MPEPILGDIVHYVLADGEQRAAVIAGNYWDGRAPLYVLPGTPSETPRVVYAALDRATQAVGTFHHPSDPDPGTVPEPPQSAPPETPFIGGTEEST